MDNSRAFASADMTGRSYKYLIRLSRRLLLEEVVVEYDDLEVSREARSFSYTGQMYGRIAAIRGHKRAKNA